MDVLPEVPRIPVRRGRKMLILVELEVLIHTPLTCSII